jgi:hypothetical protein
VRASGWLVGCRRLSGWIVMRRLFDRRRLVVVVRCAGVVIAVDAAQFVQPALTVRYVVRDGRRAAARRGGRCVATLIADGRLVGGLLAGGLLVLGLRRVCGLAVDGVRDVVLVIVQVGSVWPTPVGAGAGHRRSTGPVVVPQCMGAWGCLSESGVASAAVSMLECRTGSVPSTSENSAR